MGLSVGLSVVRLQVMNKHMIVFFLAFPLGLCV
jgi:hypothetical protein